MSTCECYQQQISQMLDGELPAEAAQTLRAHLRTCPDCRRVYDDFASLRIAMRDAAAEPPADLTARIMQQVRSEPVPAAPRPTVHTPAVHRAQPAPVRRMPRSSAHAHKRPAPGRTSPLLPISVMAACLALILGATLWFAPRMDPAARSDTALNNGRAQSAAASAPIPEDENRKQDDLSAADAEPVLDDSASSLLFSVPATASADSTPLHISDRETIEALSALLVRTHPAQPEEAGQEPLCVLEEAGADGTTTRVTVWRDGEDVLFMSSADGQYYRVPGAAAQFCRLTDLPET